MAKELGNPDRQRSLARYLAIWQGEAALDELDALLTPGYVGHMGSRSRNVTQLKHDIDAYRASASGVRFHIQHRFSEGPFVATRVTATAVRSSDGVELVAAGLNISRWEGDRLAEEWAVWEPLQPVVADRA